MNPDEYNLKIKITYNDKEYNFILKDIISLENLKEKSKTKFNLSKISNNLIEFSLKKDKNIKISTDDDIIKYIDDSNLEDLKLELNLSTKIDNRENNNQTTSELNNKEDYISKKNNLNNNNLIKENKNNISKDLLPKDEKYKYKKIMAGLEKIIKEKDEEISKYKNEIIEWGKKYEKLEKELYEEKNRNHNFNNLNNELEEAKKENSRLKKVIKHLKEKNLELENKLKNQELNINQTLNSNQNNNININQNLSTKNNNLNINQNLSTPKPNQDNNNLNLENKNIHKDCHIPATLKYKENNDNKKTESSG